MILIYQRSSCINVGGPEKPKQKVTNKSHYLIKIELLISVTICGLICSRVWQRILKIFFTETKRFCNRNIQGFPVYLGKISTAVSPISFLFGLPLIHAQKNRQLMVVLQ